jgi:hypothetical protein
MDLIDETINLFQCHLNKNLIFLFLLLKILELNTLVNALFYVNAFLRLPRHVSIGHASKYGKLILKFFFPNNSIAKNDI